MEGTSSSNSEVSRNEQSLPEDKVDVIGEGIAEQDDDHIDEIEEGMAEEGFIDQNEQQNVVDNSQDWIVVADSQRDGIVVDGTQQRDGTS